MKKPNWIGIPARDIDRIIDKAIKRIVTGEEMFSCCAFITGLNDTRGWAVRKAYTRTFGPVTSYIDNCGYAFATEVNRATNSLNEVGNLRIVMLSLFRAAWRDLV